MNTSKQALIYCRVSTKKQENEGSGLSSQEARCRDYANSNGYIVKEIFQDSFSGGGDFMKRPAMRQLLAYVDQHPGDEYVVIFDDLKRFARDVKFHWELRSEFESRNLTPECLNFKFEETPEGAFIETIIAAQGELERRQQKRQVYQKMKARFQRGIYCMATPPFGYYYVKSNVYGGKILQIEPEVAEIIKNAFTDFASGKLFHIKDVAKYMTANIPRKNKNAFMEESVKSMLSNVIYTGYVEYPKWDIELTKGIHDPIIPFEIFEKVQNRLNTKLPQRTRVDMRKDFPLRGYVNCVHCKHPLTASWSTARTGIKHPYYRCFKKGCIVNGKSISQKELHTSFENYIKSLTPKKNILKIAKLKILEESISKLKESAIEQQKLIEEVKTIEQQIMLLVERLSKPLDLTMIELYQNQISKLNKQKIALNDKIDNENYTSPENLEPLIDKAFKKLENPYLVWVNSDYTGKKNVLNMLFNTNPEYGKNESFGTSKECYVLRLFREIEAENSQNFEPVHIDKIFWKQSSMIATSVQFTLDFWNDIILEIQKIASYP